MSRPPGRKRKRQTLEEPRAVEGEGVRVAGAAHDLKQMLTSVLGHCALLRERSPELQDNRHLSCIELAARDAAAIAERLLTAQPRAGSGRTGEPLPGELVDLPLAELVGDCIDLVRPAVDALAADPRALKVEQRIPGDLHVRAIPSQLREIILNLVHNALAAMPGGGQLSISGERRGASVALRVRDTGIGMSQEQVDALLAGRRPPGPSPARPGHGLGLATVQHLLARMDGELLLNSRPGGGTEATVLLPAAAEAAEASNAGTHDVAAAGRLATEPAHERAAPEGAPLRVLIVDDEAPVRELLADVLGAEGHRCSLAATGESALAVFRAGHFEVAIIDERLPGLSGGETARRLRVRDPVVGIVLVSGWGRPFPATAEGGRSPADFQADKPFEIAVLRDLVSRAGELARRRERGTGGEGAGG